MAFRAVRRPFQRRVVTIRCLTIRCLAIPSRCGIALPPEIVLTIAAYLTKPALASLSLTCRTLHGLCFPASLDLSPTEKEELLLLLEKDIPNLYFCARCVLLHRWRTYWNASYWSTGQLQCLRRDDFVDQHGYMIPYPYARVVMNRHLYGSTHGLPIQILEGRTEKKQFFSEAKYYVTRRARIVDNQLMLLSVSTIYHPYGDSKALRDFIDRLGDRICWHMHMKSIYESCSFQFRVPELKRDSGSPSFFTPCHQSVKSCPYCLTDYSITICWHGSEKGWAIEITVYRQLGACRSPFDWTWCVADKSVWYSDPRCLYPLKYPPGIIRHMWNKADEQMTRKGEDRRLEGEWVADFQRGARMLLADRARRRHDSLDL
jgi:hypothetical protein